MQKLLLVLAGAGLLSAQSLAGLPSCAITCVGTAIPADCNLKPECICKSTSFINAISCCVSTACSAADQEATLEYARTICTPAGVTNLPKSAGCAAATSGSSGSSMSMSMTGSSAAASASSVQSSLSMSVSSAMASVSSAESSAVESASSAASSATDSAAAAATSGAANHLAAQLGAVGAGVLGVAALL